MPPKAAHSAKRRIPGGCGGKLPHEIFDILDALRWILEAFSVLAGGDLSELHISDRVD